MSFYAAFPLIERRRRKIYVGGERKPMIDRAEKPDRQQACTMWTTGREMERGGERGRERERERGKSELTAWQQEAKMEKKGGKV